MQFQRVLFPVDFSKPCEQVIPWVVEMVKRERARLTLMNVWESPYTWSGEIDPLLLEGLPNFEGLESRHRTRLEEFRRAHLPSAMAETVLRKGDPAEEILGYARKADIDLIMMPTHGYGRFRTALLGSVTATVIHDMVCAVWTSAHIEKLQSPPYPSRHIICAVDDVDKGMETLKVIRHAGLLAEDLECSLTIVHAMPPGKEDSESQVSSRLQSCEALAQVSVPISVEKGDIGTVVPEAARRYGADLLVIGRGHAPDALGSWRSHVYPIIRNSPCPVLTL
jgi:nucleotide-binding universal stress UspA family protein